MAIFTTRQALEMARDILTTASGSSVLSQAERTQCSGGSDTCSTIIGQLRADNTLAPNRRQSAFNNLKSSAQSLTTVDRAHENLPPGDLYNALDLMSSVAEPLRDGISTLELIL